MRKRYWLVLAAVVLALPLLFLEQLMVFHWTPLHAFDASKAPEAPDYHNLQAWGVHPEKNGRSTDAERMRSQPAYSFFIHPTSLRSGSDWNEDLSDEAARFERFDWIRRGQIELWRACCDSYAPHYRQATLAAYWRKKRVATKPESLPIRMF